MLCLLHTEEEASAGGEAFESDTKSQQNVSICGLYQMEFDWNQSKCVRVEVFSI